MGINYVRYLNAPKGELTVETAQDLDGTIAVPGIRPLPPDDGLWPSYNKTLTSDRFSSLNEIDRENVGRLKVLCTYDTGQYTGFNSGLVMVGGALLFATEYDTFSIDPTTCRENWRKHEDYAPATSEGVNRGVAYLDGRVFRGTQDSGVYSPMISRLANACGRPPSPTPRRARARLLRRSPGTASSSSAMPAATSKA